MTKIFCLPVVAAIGLVALMLQNDAYGRGFGGYYGNAYNGTQGRGFGGFPVEGFDSNGFINGTLIGTGVGGDGLQNGALGRQGLPIDSLNPAGISPANSAGFRFGATPGLGLSTALHGAKTGVGQRAGASNGQGFGALIGLRYFSPTYLHAQAIATQRWCTSHGYFTPEWLAGHPWPWHPTQHDPNVWAATAGNVTDWPTVAAWLGWNAAPIDYRYGDNVVYGAGKVFFDGDSFAATADDYYQQARSVAHSAALSVSGNAEWLPLGTFAVVEGEEKKPTRLFQLAIDKRGIVRGNSASDPFEQLLVVQGAVDQKSQRTAWTVGNAENTVYETGLLNLTKEEAPGLMHTGKDRTDLVLFVRLKRDNPRKSKD